MLSEYASVGRVPIFACSGLFPVLRLFQSNGGVSHGNWSSPSRACAAGGCGWSVVSARPSVSPPSGTTRATLTRRDRAVRAVETVTIRLERLGSAPRRASLKPPKGFEGSIVSADPVTGSLEALSYWEAADCRVSLLASSRKPHDRHSLQSSETYAAVVRPRNSPSSSMAPHVLPPIHMALGLRRLTERIFRNPAR